MIVPSATPLGNAREREHGQVLVLFAFVLIALLLISALAVDYGGWLLARRSYQNIADEAALAGAYQLTNPTGADCAIAAGTSKQICARRAAWTSIKNHLPGFPFDPAVLGATSSASLAVTWSDYTFWVASPPSEAGSAYTGLASSNKTVFVRVERTLQANLSRIVRQTTKVGAWATAGRIPENFAIIVLCQTGCLAGGSDVQIAGSNSTLVLESGDLGSNAFGHTGNNSSIAFCEGSPTTSQCSPYMHDAAQCPAGDTNCQLVAWTGSAVDPSIQYSALALPQVVDPKYQAPTLSSTTTPYQCYSTTTDSPPAVSMVPNEQQFAIGDPYIMAAAQLPPTQPPIALASATVTGTVKDSANGKLGTITVSLTGPSNPPNQITPASGPNKGVYTFTTVSPASPPAYTLTATDPSGVYHQATQSLAVPASGTPAIPDFHLDANPIVTGIVRDSSFNPIAGAIVHISLNGTTWDSLPSASNGTYSITAQPPAGSGPWTFSTWATASGYGGDTPYSVSANVNTTTPNQQHTLTANPGSISGTVSGTVTSSMTISTSNGASVTISSAGPYTIANVSSGTNIVVTPSPPSGFTSTPASQTVTVLPGQDKPGVNFAISAIPSGTVTGTVTDDTTGLPLSGAKVTVTQGAGTGAFATTNSSGAYTINNVTAGNNQVVTATLLGYTDTASAKFNVPAGATVSVPTLMMWPANCGTKNPPAGGKSGGYKGDWECDPAAACVPTVSGSGADVTCSAFDNTNRIRPGTYYDIILDNNSCAWIDALGGTPGVTSGQRPGIVYVTNHLSIGSNAYLFGDGISFVLGPDAYVDVGNSGGFVLDYKASTGTFANTWRTMNYIGGGTGASRVFSICATDTDGAANLDKGAFTTGGKAQTIRYSWDTSGATPCYQDGDQSPYTTTNFGEIGITWYLKGTPTKSNRFSMSSQMGFLFDGVLYGPKDDIQLGGSSGQAAAGQIVAWTLKYNGSTDIHQRYLGEEIDGAPYLIEPYIGE